METLRISRPRGTGEEFNGSTSSTCCANSTSANKWTGNKQIVTLLALRTFGVWGVMDIHRATLEVHRDSMVEEKVIMVVLE